MPSTSDYPVTLLRRYWSALIVTLLGVLSVAIVFGLSYGRAKAQAKASFENNVRRLAAQLEIEYLTTHASLLAASGFFSASEFVDENEWKAFVRTMLPDGLFDHFESFLYIDRVPLDEVDRYEQAYGERAGEPFQISRRPGRRPDIEFAAPIRFSSPEERFGQFVGLDLTSSREVCSALIRAAETRTIVRTRQFRFDLSPENEQDVTLFYPVYGGVDITEMSPAERLANTEGWVAVLIPTDQQLGRIATSLPPASEAELYKGVQNGGGVYVAGWYGPRSDEVHEADNAWTLTSSFEINNEVWALTVRRATVPRAVIVARVLPVTVTTGILAALITSLVLVMTNTRDRAMSIAAKMTRELHSKERLLQHSGKLASLGGWELDLLTNELTWSEQTRRIHEVDDEYKENVEDAINFYDGASRDTIRDAVTECIEHGTPYDLHLSFVTSKGRRLWVRSLGEAEFEGGRAVRLRGAFQDVTRQVDIERQLQFAKDEAESANIAKSQFLANMSHEIRTPMTAIIGYADVLCRAEVSEQDRRTHLTTIRRNSEHLLAIINDILDLSKIEAGCLEIERVPMSAMSVIKEVAGLYRPRAVQKGLRFSARLKTKMPERFVSDPVRLRQIVFNLVSNAIKFTSAGGVDLELAYIDESNTLSICVRDTGIGMSAEESGRIFDAFTQADISTTREYGGTGLGLKISSTLAEMLGGTLGVTSERGVGSAFTLLLTIEPDPSCHGEYQAGEIELDEACAPATMTRTNSKEIDAISMDGLRILVAEDGIDNQRLVRFILEEAGADVSIVGNGEIAITEIYRADASGKPFDVVLMDMQMPVLDGYSATRELRRKGRQIPIVALTAHAMECDKAQCLDAGCNDHVAKPINRGELLRVCSYWAALHASERRVA